MLNMFRVRIWPKAVSLLLGFSLLVLHVNAAGEPVFFLRQDFNSYLTNASPEGKTSGSVYVLEEESQQNKYLAINTDNSLASWSQSIDNNSGVLVVSMDIKAGPVIPSGEIIVLDRGGKQFAPVKFDAGGSLLTFDGKEIGGLIRNKFSTVSLVLDVGTRRFSVYINQVLRLDRWYVKANFPAAIGGIGISCFSEDKAEINLDNVYAYSGTKPIPSSSLPKGVYNNGSTVMASESAGDEDVGDAIFVLTNFDEGFGQLGSRFQAYPYTNSIETVYDTRSDNSYVEFLKNTSGDCLAQIFLSDKGENYVVMQFDLKFERFADISFIGIDTANNRATLLATQSDGRLSANTINLGELTRRQWANIAVVIDTRSKTCDYYVNKDLMGQKVALQNPDLQNVKSLQISLGAGDAEKSMMLDNLAVYQGKTLKNMEAMLKGEVDESISIINLREKEAKNALNGFRAVQLREGGYLYDGKERHMVEHTPYYEQDTLMISNDDAKKIFHASIDTSNSISKDGVGYADLKALSEKENKVVTVTDIGVAFVGDKAFESDEKTLIFINNYLLYNRPEKQELISLFQDARPRIILNEEKLNEIKKQYQVNDYMKKWGNDVIAAADMLMSLPGVVYAKSDGLRLLPVSQEAFKRISNFAMAFHLTNDSKYAERAWIELEAVCTGFPDWNQGVHTLDSAEMTKAVAVGYDWLYDQWSEDQRETMRKALNDYSLIYSYQSYHGARRVDYGWATANNNWNALCNGGVIIGAAALFETNPELYSDIIKEALRGHENVLNEFYPDGAWQEGVGYWAGTVEPLAYTIDALENTFGTDFNLSKAPGFSRTGEFPIIASGTNGTLAYHDNAGTAMTQPVTFWLSNKFDNAGLSEARLFDINYKGAATSIQDLLFFNTSYTGSKVTMPLDGYLRGVEVVGMRSDWESSQATYVGYHSGVLVGNNYHAHMDSGTFIIDMLGERFATEMGTENYNLPGMSDLAHGRWQYYSNHPEGHNCLIINPKPGVLPMNINAVDKVETLVSKPRGAYSITGLSNCYVNEANSVRRGFMLADERRSVVIRDEIDLKHNDSEIYWFMHTDGTVSIEDGHAIIEKNGKKVKLSYITNAAASEITVKKAVQLFPDESVVATQKDLSKYSKVSIRLKASGKVNLTVKVIPYDDPNANNPIDDSPLDKWSIPDGEIKPLPTLTGINADGMPIGEFNPNNVSYSAKYSFEAQTAPVVTATADDSYEVVVTQDINTFDAAVISVYDKADKARYRNYYVTFAVDMSSIDKYRYQPANVMVSATPEPANVASNVYDNNLNTRWSAEGDGQWLVMDLGEEKKISYIGVAFFNGASRQTKYELLVSIDNETWTPLFNGLSSGTTIDIEVTEKLDISARYIKFIGYGNTANKWNSITEFAVYGLN